MSTTWLTGNAETLGATEGEPAGAFKIVYDYVVAALAEESNTITSATVLANANAALDLLSETCKPLIVRYSGADLTPVTSTGPTGLTDRYSFTLPTTMAGNVTQLLYDGEEMQFLPPDDFELRAVDSPTTYPSLFRRVYTITGNKVYVLGTDITTSKLKIWAAQYLPHYDISGTVDPTASCPQGSILLPAYYVLWNFRTDAGVPAEVNRQTLYKAKWDSGISTLSFQAETRDARPWRF